MPLWLNNEDDSAVDLAEEEIANLWAISEKFHGQVKTRMHQCTCAGPLPLFTSELKAIEVSFPSLPEQIAIAGVLSNLDAELAGLEQRRAKNRALKQGMVQELLTGRAWLR